MKLEAVLRRLAKLELRILELEKENLILKERLVKYENPKNSRNSSIPPSQDQNRPKANQSLRKSSGKKVGGQKGRKGKTLEMVAVANEIIKLHPNFCRSCGTSLSTQEAIKNQHRQLVDIPPVKAIFTEYQTYIKTCICGCQNTADFPDGVNSHIGYGENIEGLIGYFHARQYLPFARMQEMFNDVFNIDISEGGIHYLLSRFANKVSPFYAEIKQRLSESKVIGADETGVKVNGNKQWFWAWQTTKLTYITHSNNRKGTTVKEHFPNGFPKSTLVHDGWKPQFNTLSKHHQLCIAHLQRNLNHLIELYPKSKWAKQLLQLFYDSLELHKKKNQTNKKHCMERDKILERFQKLLSKPPNKTNKKLYTFYKRMRREQESLFTFLFVEQVPSDNNASERAIRNVKVKQKISGQFKTELAAQNFAKIRSVIDTVIKNGNNVIDALALVAKIQLFPVTD